MKLFWLSLVWLGLSAGCTSLEKSELTLPAANAAARDQKAYDARLSELVYPYPVKSLALSSQRQNLEMVYMDIFPEADKANYKTVLLLHGKNFSGLYWRDTIRILLEQGFRVIVPDQIGFGKSSKPQAYQFSFHQLAQNTVVLLDHLGVPKTSVVGHSMGGMLATRLALMRPDRVEKLVLVNPIGLEDWKTQVPYTPVEKVFEQELNKTGAQIKDYMAKSYFDGQWKPEYNELIGMHLGWLNHPEYPAVAWNSALTYDMVFTQPVLYEFSRIKVPTLLIIGQRDRTALGKQSVSPEVARELGNYPRLGRKAARAIPKAKILEIQGAGHLPQVEAFEPYRQALLSFLK